MPKPDFSGTWTFNRARSVLQIPPPDSSIFVVTHREPNFRLSRTHVYGGKSDTFTLDLVTDGREIPFAHGELKTVCRAFWEGDVLMFDSHLVKDEEHATNTVRYTLSAESNTMIAQERFRSERLNYDNMWILERR